MNIDIAHKFTVSALLNFLTSAAVNEWKSLLQGHLPLEWQVFIQQFCCILVFI
jgi:hypothetical protein